MVNFREVTMTAQIFSKKLYVFDVDAGNRRFRPNQFKLFVDPQGIIRWVPLTSQKWENQNQDLPAVKQKLKTIMTEIENKNSQIYATLKNEIHQHGALGFMALTGNLTHLNDQFSETPNCLYALINKVVNFFKWLFCCPAVTESEWIDVQRFQNCIKEAALRLMPEDIERAKYVSTVSPQFEEILGSENIQKLELGLINSIHFEHGTNSYALRFNLERERFSLDFLGNNELNSLVLSANTTRIAQSVFARVTEELNGNIGTGTFEKRRIIQRTERGQEHFYEGNATHDLTLDATYTLEDLNVAPISFSIRNKP